jgi:hypothetical protein
VLLADGGGQIGAVIPIDLPIETLQHTSHETCPPIKY